jgi:5-methylcytosine-specific restriction endonuclease McrA
MSSSKRRARDAVYPERRLAVYERSNGRCEALVAPACTGRCEHVHHVAGRGGSDPHRLENLLGVCVPCHDRIHGNPAEAMRLGFLRSRHTRRDDPAD